MWILNLNRSNGSSLCLDNCEFQIPNLTPPCSPRTPTYQRSRSGSSELGDLNLDLYKNVLSSDSEDEKFSFPATFQHNQSSNKSKGSAPNTPDINSGSFDKLHYLEQDIENKKNTNSLGTITCSFRYIPKEHRLLVKLIDISLNYQPSTEVKECNWTLNPILIVDVTKDVRSPENKRKLASVFHKNSFLSLEKEGTCSIALKHKTNDHYYIKMILYDGDIKHRELAIGAVHINILNTISSDGSEKIITKELSTYHQVNYPCKSFKNFQSASETEKACI